MKKWLLLFCVTCTFLICSVSVWACQMHGNGFGAFAAYHQNNRYSAMMNETTGFPTVTLAQKAVVKVGSENTQSVNIVVPLSYYNASLTVQVSDDIKLLSEQDLILNAVSGNYDLSFSSTKPGTHKITLTLNAIYEGSVFSTSQTLIVEAG